jgi:hypothetical protein
MAGFVRRFTSEPTIEQILEIEGVVIIDLAPPPPATGVGTGTVLLFGEMEDGPMAAEVDEGPLEVFGSTDLLQKFGGFGYEYDGVVSQNPSARRHLQELWNGNGFLKLFKLRASRLIIARVDTSVGTVSFDPLACAQGTFGPYQLANGDVLTVETGAGGPASSTAVNGVPVTIAGVGAAFGTITSGETTGIKIDGGPQVNVIFAATDTTPALVAARINAALGYTAAVVNGAEVDISGIRPGNGGSVELIDVTAGTLAKLGQVEGVWEDKGLIAGAASAIGTILAGENFDVTLDAGAPITVTFAGPPASMAAAALDINTQVGVDVAFETPDGELRFYGGSVGTGGLITLAAGAPDALAKLGHAPGAAAGVSNVSDLNAVTATEVAAIVNGTAGLSAINVEGSLGPDGEIRICDDTPGEDIVAITATAMATAIGIPDSQIGVAISGTDHEGGNILAGSRVRTVGGDEWVVMQTLVIPAGEAGPYVAKVRPALDDGTAAGTAVNTVTVSVDPQEFAVLTVNNPQALTAALTEPQLDNAYIAAMNATLNPEHATREANFSLAARRSDAVVREGLANAIKATSDGLLGRKFISGDPLGTTINEAIANVAQFASAGSDRLFYTAKGLKVRIPEIAAVGTDGGLGFTEDGVITVRPDGPLATVCALLPSENNPGQATGLIEDFFQVDSFGETLDIEAYKAFKRNGISAPRIDRQSGTVFQSGVTTSTDPARVTMARRKIADEIQDAAAEVLNPYSKIVNRQSARDLVYGVWEGYLSGLAAEESPDLSRIVSFSVDDSVNAGNTPAVLAKGVYYLETRVRTLSSLDDIVVRTEIGEGVVTSTVLAA